MRIAVTGATGFIGRHVMAELGKHPVEVVAVIRPSSTRAHEVEASEVVSLDLHDPPANVFDRLGRPDALIHLAWSGLPNYHSLHHFETELPAQYRFLKGLVESGLSHLVVAGSCFEYGMQSGPLSADKEPRPTNPYGFAKDVLRQKLGYFHEFCPYRLTWARLFYLYGDGQSESALYSQLKSAVARGEKVFNMSGGEQLRDYLEVSNAAMQIVKLATDGAQTGIVNVCSGRPVSVRRLVEGWIEENQWTIALNLGHYPYPTYEPMAFWGQHSPENV